MKNFQVKGEIIKTIDTTKFTNIPIGTEFDGSFSYDPTLLDQPVTGNKTYYNAEGHLRVKINNEEWETSLHKELQFSPNRIRFWNNSGVTRPIYIENIAGLIHTGFSFTFEGSVHPFSIDINEFTKAEVFIELGMHEDGGDNFYQYVGEITEITEITAPSPPIGLQIP